MNQQLLYIGDDELLAHNLSGILLNVLHEPIQIFKNNTDAVNWLDAQQDLNDPIVLYERESLQLDVSNINLLRNKFPQIFVLLVTDDLPEQDRIYYIKSGVTDTISTTAGVEEFAAFFQFIDKYKHQKDNRVHQNFSKMGSFKMPISKRVFDVLFSLLALLLLSPLLLLVALAIRIESKGPIFYKSKRVGSNYQVFDFWKFRSMYIDADKRLKEMKEFNQYVPSAIESETQTIQTDDLDIQNIELSAENFLVDDDFIIPEENFVTKSKQIKDNAFVKFEKDPRITRVGQFIRKFSIDELPQLINILKGDMSIVGNRPLPLYEAELLTQDNSVERFIAPAGLTGLWQVQKRGDSGKLSAEQRKQLDIYYARHFSIWLDLKIFLRTFTAFIQKEDV